MNETTVKIHIIPYGVDLKYVIGYDEKSDGSSFSNLDKMKINNASYGFSLLYYDVTFKEIDTKSIVNKLMVIFSKHLADHNVKIELHYDMNVNIPDEDNQMLFNVDVAKAILVLHSMLNNITNENIEYIQTDSVVNTASVILSIGNKKKNPEDIIDEMDDEDIEEDVKVPNKKVEKVADSLEIVNRMLTGSSGDSKKKRKKHKKNKFDDEYSPSRALRSSDHPRRDYKRHGVIIAKESAIEKDEKTIKEFLKDFIPGNASWKKNLRKDLVKRWTRTYAIRKKDLRKLEKAHSKSRKKKPQRYIDVDKAIGLTANLLTKPIDYWNDPNR